MISLAKKRMRWGRSGRDTTYSFWTPSSAKALRKSPWSEIRSKPHPRIYQENRLIDQAIEQSKFILSICELDGEPTAYSEETLRRATSYLRRMALMADIKSYILPSPRIVPADEGSIDVLWKERDRSLLINFPSGSDHVTFAGRKREIQTSGVILTDDAREELVRWLCV